MLDNTITPSIISHTVNQEIIPHYMALFNTIDKSMDQYIDADWFMPFNEKIKYIYTSWLPISSMVARYEQSLKLFGEIRNHLVHSFKLNGATYLLPTHEAIEELSHLVTLFTNPPQCEQYCHHFPKLIQQADSLLSAMNIMKQHHIEHIPIVDNNNIYISSLSYALICDWIVSNPTQDITNQLSISTMLQDIHNNNWPSRHISKYIYLPIHKHATMYEAEHYFKQSSQELWALYITEDGTFWSPIIGSISVSDIALFLNHEWISTTL